MSTNIYLVRHAESKYIPNDDDYNRPLSSKGKKDAKRLVKFFSDFNITKVISSPYLRAVHTVEVIAKDKDLEIELINDFRERTVANYYLNDEEFTKFVKLQWKDFDYYLDGGESLREVQDRGVNGLKEVVQQYNNENIIIGTHGTWLAVILNYFHEKYNYEFWMSLKMPDIFLLNYQNKKLKHIKHLEV